MPLFLTFLAEAQALDGALGAAFETFEKALVVNLHERVYRPYIMLCRGELNTRLRRQPEAEADFRAALAEADKMGAAADALRAASGLARVLRAGDGEDAAQALLASRLDAVTPGPETRDVQEAKFLLRELMRQPPTLRIGD